jgi:hypothetical protein
LNNDLIENIKSAGNMLFNHPHNTQPGILKQYRRNFKDSLNGFIPAATKTYYGRARIIEKSDKWNWGIQLTALPWSITY